MKRKKGERKRVFFVASQQKKQHSLTGKQAKAERESKPQTLQIKCSSCCLRERKEEKGEPKAKSLRLTLLRLIQLISLTLASLLDCSSPLVPNLASFSSEAATWGRRRRLWWVGFYLGFFSHEVFLPLFLALQHGSPALGASFMGWGLFPSEEKAVGVEEAVTQACKVPSPTLDSSCLCVCVAFFLSPSSSPFL